VTSRIDGTIVSGNRTNNIRYFGMDWGSSRRICGCMNPAKPHRGPTLAPPLTQSRQSLARLGIASGNRSAFKKHWGLLKNTNFAQRLIDIDSKSQRVLGSLYRPILHRSSFSAGPPVVLRLDPSPYTVEPKGESAFVPPLLQFSSVAIDLRSIIGTAIW